MAIMAAGVHKAVILGTVGDFVFFLNAQSVCVGP
jgi:hypothetical protein